MPVVRMHRILQSLNKDSAIYIAGDLDVTDGLTLILSSTVFTKRGTWLLIKYDGSLVGYSNNITVTNNTLFLYNLVVDITNKTISIKLS